VTQGVIAKLTIFPMSPFEFPVLGTAGGKASATYLATLGEYPTGPVVDAPPTALFSAGCDHATLTCTLDASGSTDDVGIVSYDWDLNKLPGGTATGKIVTVTYPHAGSRTPTLTVTDTKGQKTSFSMTLQIGVSPGQPPIALFNSSCPSACTFDSSPSSGSSTLVRSWDFGDGSTAGDVVTPTHTYAAPGVYAVVLKVTDNFGISSSMVAAQVIGMPAAAGSWSLSWDCSSPGTCKFSSSVSPANPPATLSWRFGDGTTAGNVSSPTHTYSAAGTYVVTMIATDALGKTAATSVLAKVSTPPPPPPPVDAPPVARFSWTCAGQQYPHQCAFNAATSTDDIGIISYKWDWGNGRGETKTLPTVRNTWAAAGTYSVTLTVKDAAGQTNSATLPVVVP
jgi:PKD repeat protein